MKHTIILRVYEFWNKQIRPYLIINAASLIAFLARLASFIGFRKNAFFELQTQERG